MTKLERLQLARSLFPDAHCELNAETPFQLLIAVLLSAQTTDVNVNKATVNLFKYFPTEKELKNGDPIVVHDLIKTIGLAKTKTKHIIETAKIIDEQFAGVVPDKKEQLVTLPGVGGKTANVVLANVFDQNYIAVDTHVERVSKRLKIVKESATPLEVEKALIRILKGERLGDYHHSLIFFGRYFCKARNPNCDVCPLAQECRYYKNILRK